MRFAAAVLVLLALVLAPGRADAAMMRHYDLTSLALLSEAIIGAKKIGERKVDTYTTLTRYRVTKTYAGPLSPGDEIELEHGLYATDGVDIYTDRKAVVSDEVFAFLARGNKKAGDWWLVSSGLRIVQDGVVHRFEQWNNPGGFTAVPQRRDPWDLLGDPRAGPPLTPAEFDAEVPRAIARAEQIRRTIAMPRGPDRTRALLALLGPEEPDEDGPTWNGAFGFATDEAARVVWRAIAETKDLPAALDGLVRGSVSLDLARAPFSVDELLDAALDRSSPPRRRAAAIRLVQETSWPDLRRSARAASVAITLLDDPSVEVRRAAAAFGPEERPSEATIRALLARFPKEKDTGVRLVLLDRLRTADALDRLSFEGVRMPLVHGERHGRALAIAWSDRYTDREHWRLARLVVRARKGSTIREQIVDLRKTTSHSSSVDGVNALVELTPALDAGTWDLEAEVELERDKRPRESWKLPLGTVTVGAKKLLGPLPVLDPLPVLEEPSDDDAGVPDAGLVPTLPKVPPRRGCGCRAPGWTDEAPWPLALLGAALAIAGWRRRTGPR